MKNEIGVNFGSNFRPPLGKKGKTLRKARNSLNNKQGHKEFQKGKEMKIREHSQRTSAQGSPNTVCRDPQTTFRTLLGFDRFPRKTTFQTKQPEHWMASAELSQICVGPSFSGVWRRGEIGKG